MSHTEVRFTDRCFEDEAKPHLGRLVDKITTMANDTAKQRFGKTALVDPSDIELTPIVDSDQQASVIMRMWHQTTGDRPAIFQPHDTTFAMKLQGENAFIVSEDSLAYPLTARETLVLNTVAAQAVINSLSSTPPH